MSDYTIIENLSDDEILNLYDDVISISYEYRYPIYCVCNDDTEHYYTGYYNGELCPKDRIFYEHKYSWCVTNKCVKHDGMKFFHANPESIDCWRQ